MTEVAISVVRCAPSKVCTPPFLNLRPVKSVYFRLDHKPQRSSSHLQEADRLSLSLADLGRVCESILHTLPDEQRNFDTVSVRP